VFRGGESDGHVTIWIDDRHFDFESQMVDYELTPGTMRVTGNAALVDEFAIFDRALNQNEIAAIRKLGRDSR
jgi:hypothetical protein